MSCPGWPKAVPLLVLAGLCAYANCYTKTLVFDDDAWIADNDTLDDPVEYFKSMEGRPLLAATNLAVHRMGRNNPLGHHVLNVLIHIAAGLTLYGVVRRALLSPRFGGRFEGRAEYLAFAVALLWLLHPLQVQCVTYIIQRGESMAGLFYLLMLYAMQRANAVGAPRHPPVTEDAGDGVPNAVPVERWYHVRWRTVPWYALAILSLILGWGSKEILATAPGAVIPFDRIFLAGSIREMIRRRWLFYLVFLTVWGGFTYWHLTRATGSSSGIGFGIEAVTPRTYALTEAGVLLYYLRIAVWPRGLAIDYQSWPWARTLPDAMPEVAIVGGMLLVTAILIFWRPALGFVCAWFFLILLPTSSVLPIVDAVFEHRMYLSLASVAVLVVFLGDWLLRTVRLAWMRPYALAAAALVLGVLTHLRNEEYRSRAVIWQVAMDRMPDSVRARANLAHGLMGEDRAAEVIPVLERALELSPKDPTALQNLAAAHEQLGQFADASVYYGRLAETYADNWKHWRMYADTLLVVGDWAKAEEAYRKAEERNGDDAAPHYGRAVALEQLGFKDDAEAELAKASAVSPDWPAAVLAMARGVILNEKLRANPEARRSALYWAKLGRRHTDNPHPQALDTLGLCYAANGDFAQAAAVSAEAVLETPTGPWGSLHRDRLRYYRAGRVPWE
jgi:protein O-mannosyl-transferase